MHQPLVTDALILYQHKFTQFSKPLQMDEPGVTDARATYRQELESTQRTDPRHSFVGKLFRGQGQRRQVLQSFQKMETSAMNIIGSELQTTELTEALKTR